MQNKLVRTAYNEDKSIRVFTKQQSTLFSRGGFCLYFDLAAQYVESVPNQGSNLRPLQWKCSLNHWTTRDVPTCLYMSLIILLGKTYH